MSGTRIDTKSGYIRVTGFHPQEGVIGIDAFSTTGDRGTAYSDLSVESAKELVRALIDRIEKAEGSPF